MYSREACRPQRVTQVPYQESIPRVGDFARDPHTQGLYHPPASSQVCAIPRAHKTGALPHFAQSSIAIQALDKLPAPPHSLKHTGEGHDPSAGKGLLPPAPAPRLRLPGRACLMCANDHVRCTPCATGPGCCAAGRHQPWVGLVLPMAICPSPHLPLAPHPAYAPPAGSNNEHHDEACHGSLPRGRRRQVREQSRWLAICVLESPTRMASACPALSSKAHWARQPLHRQQYAHAFLYGRPWGPVGVGCGGPRTRVGCTHGCNPSCPSIFARAGPLPPPSAHPWPAVCP